MKNASLVFFFVFFSSAIFAQKKCDSLVLTVPVDTFHMLLEKHDGILLDVRTPEEWKTGYIKGAINIDYRSDDFKTKISALDKSKTYYVYCEIGGRSALASEYMKSQGFCKVVALHRGLRSWKEMGYPTTISAKK